MKSLARREAPTLAEIDEMIAAHSDFLRSRMQAALTGVAGQAKPTPTTTSQETPTRIGADDRESQGAITAHSPGGLEDIERNQSGNGTGPARPLSGEFFGNCPDKLFRVLMERLPEGIFVLDPHNPEMPGPVAVFNGANHNGHSGPNKCAWTLGWPIVECNEAACRQFGYQREELIGQPVGLAGPLTDRHELLAGLLEKLKSENVARFTAFHRRKDGTYFQSEVSSTLIRDSGREWVLSLIQNAPVRDKAQAEVEKLAAFARCYPQPIFEFGPEGQLNFFNAAAKALTHSAGEETPLRVVPPGTARIVQECLAAGKNTNHLVTRLANRTLEWSFYPVIASRVVYALARDVVLGADAGTSSAPPTVANASDEVTGSVRIEFNQMLAAMRELVDQIKQTPVPAVAVAERVEIPVASKPAEEDAVLEMTRIQRVEEAFRKREASFVMAQQIAQVGSWELDLAAGKLEWSAETFRIFGYQPDEVTPTCEALHELVHSAHRDAVKQLFQEATQSAKPYNSEHRIVRRDGSERWVCEQTAVLSDEGGKPARVVGTVQDTTQRKQQEEHSRNVEKWEAIGRLAGGVAHDFNKILTDIRECTKVIQAAPNIDAEVARQLKQLSAAAERATSLTWHLLSLSRKQARKATYLDLNELIQQIIQMLQHVLGTNVQVELRLGSDLPKIPGDSSMLEQVLLNLAINSRYAMQKGGRLTIETRLSEVDAAYVSQQPEAHVGRYVCLRLSDTGGGVDASRMGCLHEPFFTTKDLGQGTGLGLATVHGIVKGHQGWIDVVSEVGSGATFKVYLPTQNGAEALTTERPQKPICGGSETILLVEGDALMRALARSILQRYGYQILDAGSGSEALALWEKHADEIHLLLTDMTLTDGVKGREFAQQLQEKKAALKVLYMSGYSQDLTQHCRFLKPGLTFLPKPYSATALAQAVRHCLDREEDQDTSVGGQGASQLPVLYEQPVHSDLSGNPAPSFVAGDDTSILRRAEATLSMA